MTIFLSYHHSKAKTAEHLASYFERNGVQTWFAPRDVPPGSVWDEVISEAIAQSNALVLLFCSEADASQHIKREINLADRNRVPIYWVRLEKVEPDKLGYYLNSTQWFDWLDERDATLEVLVQDLRREHGGSPAESAVVDVSTSSAVVAPGVVRQTPPLDPVWPRAVYALPSERDASAAAAHLILKQAGSGECGSILLPTGRLATHVFRAVVKLAPKYGEEPFGDVHILNDTETFGVGPKHDTSRSRHVRESLIVPLGRKGIEVDEAQVHLLKGVFLEDDPLREAQKLLREWPPLLHVLSVAPNGELLAYEVGTYTDIEEVVNDGPRVVEVSEHGRAYIDGSQPSKSILTIGMGAAMEARTCVPVFLDIQKAGVLGRMLRGGETAGIPATVLRRHLNCHIISTHRVVEEAGVVGFVSDLSPEAVAERILESC